MDIAVIHVDTPHGLTDRQVASALGLAIVFSGIVLGHRVDRDKYAEFLPEQPRISTAHTIVQCEVCSCDIWIGPKQLQMHKRGIPVMCMLCHAVGDNLRGQIYAELSKLADLARPATGVALDPDADERPTRT